MYSSDDKRKILSQRQAEVKVAVYSASQEQPQTWQRDAIAALGLGLLAAWFAIAL